MWHGPGHGGDPAAEAELWGLLVAELTHFQGVMGASGGGYMLRGDHPTAAGGRQITPNHPLITPYHPHHSLPLHCTLFSLTACYVLIIPLNT